MQRIRRRQQLNTCNCASRRSQRKNQWRIGTVKYWNEITEQQQKNPQTSTAGRNQGMVFWSRITAITKRPTSSSPSTDKRTHGNTSKSQARQKALDAEVGDGTKSSRWWAEPKRTKQYAKTTNDNKTTNPKCAVEFIQTMKTINTLLLQCFLCSRKKEDTAQSIKNNERPNQWIQRGWNVVERKG